jgi:hypothetical protein
MSVLLTLLALAGAPPPAPGGSVQSGMVPVIAAAERLILPPLRPPVTLAVDPLGGRIVLRTAAAAAATAVRVRPLLGSLCPIAVAEGNALVLRCRTRRLDAGLSFERGRAVLDVRELRGLPFRDPDQRLNVFYDPAVLAGDPCPGSTPAARGECALAAHEPNQAALQFRLAVGTGQHAWAALRLGDLALANEDAVGALRWYIRAGTEGPFGRMAFLRRCELTGGCLASPRSIAFSFVALPDMMAAEVELRAARADAFEGRLQRGLDRLGALLASPSTRGICADAGLRFCRRLLLDLLEQSDATTARAALDVYLQLPRRLEGPMVLELARAAAERAAALGAPVFGGSVMTSVFQIVSPDEIAEHLLRTAELFAAGNDLAKAGVVLEYAESRLDARQMSDARWLALRARLREQENAATASVDPRVARRIEELSRQAAADLAAGRALAERARAISAAPALVRPSQ